MASSRFEGAGRPMPGGQETILVVEDESAVRTLVVRMLGLYGYKVLEAESGVAALKLWQDHKDTIALLLTDMIMPEGMNGLDLTRALRLERPDLKVVLSSGYSSELAARGKLLPERCVFLQKPYEPRRLATLIRECLDSDPPCSEGSCVSQG